MPSTQEFRKKLGEAITPLESQEQFTVRLINRAESRVLDSVTSSKHCVLTTICDWLDRTDEFTALIVRREGEQE